MKRKRKRIISISEETKKKWDEQLIQKRNKSRSNTVSAAKESVSLSQQRKDAQEIKHIESIQDVDEAIDCFVWPTLQYDKSNDFYFQGLLRGNKQLLEYYHEKMKRYFGIEHALIIEHLSRHLFSRSTGSSPSRRIIKTQTKSKEEKTKPSTPKRELPKDIKSSFNVIQKQDWILDWKCVRFRDGYIVVLPPEKGRIKFKPESLSVSGAHESFNYLKDYLNERLSPVHCSVEGMKLTIYDTIRLNEAIQTFAKESKLRSVKVGASAANGKKIVPKQISFTQALSLAKQMSPEEFKKYKSEYIDFLVEQQSEKYKVVPCVENLTHVTGDTTEYAFLFSIECKPEVYLIVHENVNPDRSTLLFYVDANKYDKAIREIYNFLQSAEINKRSNLRERNIDIRNTNINYYRSINHDDINSWKSSIVLYNIEKAGLNPGGTKQMVGFNTPKTMSLSRAISEIKSKQYWRGGLGKALAKVGINNRGDLNINTFMKLVPKNILGAGSSEEKKIGIWVNSRIKDSQGNYKSKLKILNKFSVNDLFEILAQNGIEIILQNTNKN